MRIAVLISATLFVFGGNLPSRAATGKKPKPAASQTLELKSITARIPGGWKLQPTDREFRLAQYAIPKAKGENAEVLSSCSTSVGAAAVRLKRTLSAGSG
jgi:hypothetical protein